MRASLPLAAAAIALAAGCAHDVRAAYPSQPDEPTGTVELVFASPASSVSVAVNGVLLVRGERTEKVTITGVPTGYAEVAIAAGPGEKSARLWVDTGETTSLPLPSTGEAPASALRQLATSVISVALYALLR